MSTIYSKALAAYLERNAARQTDVADAAKCTQAAISRYAQGKRFPERRIAEEIERATEGEVPLSLWRVVAAEKAGLAA